MGLLDSLFNQSTYGGQGGGLLDFLRQSQMQQEQYQPSAGFPGQAPPIAVGGYQMPRVGDQAQFTPPPQDPAALPSNAQPAQGQLPPQEPGLGDRFMAGAQTFFGNPGGGVIPNLLNGINAFQTGQAGGSRNQTAQFLVSKGIDPALAKTIVSDPSLLRSVLPQVLGTGGQTDDIKEYQFAKRENPSLTFEKFMQQKKAVSGEYSLTPQYGTNEKGETVLIQTGKSGTAIQTVLPAGVKISSGVDKIDLGTSWGLIDRRTGQMVGQQAKDIEGKEAAEKRGEARGVAEVALPTVIATAERSLALVDEMIKHPGRGTATGASGTFDPRNYFAGTDATNFRVRAEQMQGRTFLEAFQQLKGAGAITEQEGKAATSAIARLNTAQSDDEYLVALNELKSIINKGVEVARQRAGKGGQAPQAPAATDLKKKYGLD